MVAFAAVRMSFILNYFARADKDTSSNVVIPTGGVPGILHRQIFIMAGQIQSTSGVKHKRVTYGELDKMKITKHANACGCGIANAVI